MSDSKITQFPESTSPHASDIFPFVDLSSVPADNKITMSHLMMAILAQVTAVNKQTISTDALGNSLINSAIFIQNSLWTFNGKQYCAFANSSGHVMCGKQSSTTGVWTVSDTGVTIDTSDIHNVVSMGIDPDGYIHIAYGIHATPLQYIKSNNPEDPSAFTAASMTGDTESVMSYPKFFLANNILYFTYRDLTSVNGDQLLNKYNKTTKTWATVFHPLISGGGTTGVYIDNVAVDNNGYIHMSFMFRQSSDNYTNSNYGYAYSADGGATWKKADGSVQTVPITAANADIFDAGGLNAQMVNQNGLDIDGNGHPHIAYWKKSANGHCNYYHAWHDGSSWYIAQISNYAFTQINYSSGTVLGSYDAFDLARAAILINRTSGRVYIFTRPFNGSQIVVWVADAPYTTFRPRVLGLDGWGYSEFGSINYNQWHASHVFNIMISQQGSGNPIPLFLLTSDLETSIIGVTGL